MAQTPFAQTPLLKHRLLGGELAQAQRVMPLRVGRVVSSGTTDVYLRDWADVKGDTLTSARAKGGGHSLKSLGSPGRTARRSLLLLLHCTGVRSEHLEFIPGSRGSRQSRQSGGINYGSEPPFHTRQG